MGSAKWVDITVVNNFKFLYQRYKDGQKVLGKMFGVSQGIISDYVNGKRPIPIAVLKSISEWYGIPVKELLYKDLSTEMESPQFIDINTLECIGTKLFPFLTSDKATCNSNFRCADRIVSSVMKLDSFEELCKKDPALIQAADLYKDAWEETNAYAAIVNHLSTILLVYMIYCQPNVKAVQMMLQSDRFDLIDFESELRFDPSKSKELPNEKKRKAFVEKRENDVYEYIKILKKNPQFTELGDYYLALYNLFAFTVDFSEREDCSKAGGYMFGQLYMLDNEYVKRLIET